MSRSSTRFIRDSNPREGEAEFLDSSVKIINHVVSAFESQLNTACSATRDDLVQAARAGVLGAYRQHDGTKAAALTSLAYSYARWAIIEELRTATWGTKLATCREERKSQRVVHSKQIGYESDLMNRPSKFSKEEEEPNSPLEEAQSLWSDGRPPDVQAMLERRVSLERLKSNIGKLPPRQKLAIESWIENDGHLSRAFGERANCLSSSFSLAKIKLRKALTA